MVEAIDESVVEDHPSMRRYAREMRASVRTLVVLVDDLFELVQIDAGAIEAESDRARLEDVIHAAMAACSPQAAAKELRIDTHLEGVTDVVCSPRMVRVIQNLLTNAIRHTPSDGTVTIDASLDHGGFTVAVIDTGEGIPSSDLSRVFDPFWQGDPARSREGSGLGLALAQRIVQALNGSLDAQSDPGRGSRFRVWLPIASAK
jgi:signal transduction histidine kinase